MVAGMGELVEETEVIIKLSDNENERRVVR